MIKSILQTIYPIKNYSIILADGLFPQDKYLRSLFIDAHNIICCDGAINQLIKLDITPHYIVGDCDSMSEDIQDRFSDIIIKIVDQNYNDLTKAVDLANSMQLDNIIILGATGLREDHTLANIALLSNYSKLIKNIVIISDFGIFTSFVGEIQLKTIKNQQVSFFTTNLATIINCKELKWPLINHQFELWNSGSLNQAVDKVINIEASGQVIVFRAFSDNKKHVPSDQYF